MGFFFLFFNAMNDPEKKNVSLRRLNEESHMGIM